MGGGESKSKEETPIKTTENEMEVYLSEGAWGKTYRKGKHVIKRLKYDENDEDIKREIAFLKWVETLKSNEQIYFSRMIKHEIYEDTTFIHLSKEFEMYSPEIKAKMLERNKRNKTLDIVIEYKGRKIEPSKFSGLSTRDKYKMLLQLLNIIRIMRKSNVYHEDIHEGNILIDDETGNIALIDYGTTFFKGQRSSEIEGRNEMMVQVTSVMSNFGSFLSVLDRDRKINPHKPSLNPDTDFYPFLEKHKETVHDLISYVKEFARKNYYTMTITNTEKNIIEIHPTIFAVSDNLLRISHPNLYLQLYDLQSNVPPPYFGLDDLKIVYDNWNDIDKIISLFESKARE